MTPFLFALTFALAFAYWVIVYKNWYKAELFFKPAVMASLLLTILFTRPTLSNGLIYFFAAIVFSMIGDILLLFPSRFMLGLVMFLAAHVCYIIGFNIPLPKFDLFTVLLAIFVAILAGRLYQRIDIGLVQKGLRRLQIPVRVYMIVLSLMFISGFSTLFRTDWPAWSALLAAGGVLSFVASDTMLAWDKFVHPLRTRRVGYMIAYHVGQIAIVAAALLKL